MDIFDRKTAQAYVVAWAGHSPERRARMYRIAAQGQRACVGLAGPKHPEAAKAHREAAEVLEKAAALLAGL